MEDAIDDELAGKGEVTGIGMGESGSNIDIEIFAESIGKLSALKMIRDGLIHFKIPSSTLIKINGEEFPFHEVL